jgi:MFS family permease
MPGLSLENPRYWTAIIEQDDRNKGERVMEEEKKVVSPQDLTGGKKTFLILSVVMLTITAMMSNYGGAIVVPSKLREINGMDYYSVVSALASMGMMLALPLVGMLSAKFGAKAVALTGLIMQAVVRLVVIFTPAVFPFAVLWAFNGIFGGLYISAPYSIMGSIVKPEERAKYYGMLATGAAIGSLGGPAITGFVIDRFSTDLALMAYVVFGIIPLIGLSWLFPNQKRPGTGKFDGAGIALLVLAVCGIVLWLSLGGKLFPFISPLGLGFLFMGLVCLVLLIVVEGKSANPSVPIHMLKKKRFRFTFLIQALMVAYSTGVMTYGIVYVTQVMGQSSLVGSTVSMPQTIVQLICGVTLGAFISRAFKKRFPIMGKLTLIIYTAALLIFASLNPHSPMLLIYVATAMGGVGQAISQATFTAFFQTELKPEEFPAAQGMYQFASSGASSVMTSVFGAALNMGFSLNNIFFLAACMVGVATVIAFIGFRFPKEEVLAEAQAAAAKG